MIPPITLGQELKWIGTVCQTERSISGVAADVSLTGGLGVEGMNADVRFVAKQMIEACQDEADTKVRWECQRRLVKIGKASVPVLISLLTHPLVDVRLLSVDALGKIGDLSAAPALERTLESDPNHDVQGVAAEALGRLRDNRNLAPLLRALNTGSTGKRMDAVRAVARLGSPQSVPNLMRVAAELDASGEDLLAAYVRLAAAYVEKGLHALQSVLVSSTSGSQDRVRAVSLLSLSNSMEAVEMVMAYLGDPDEGVRSSALSALGELVRDLRPQGTPLGKEISARLALTLTSDDSGRNRMIAAGMLGALADRGCLPVLEKAATADVHEPTRRWAADAVRAIRRQSSKN